MANLFNSNPLMGLGLALSTFGGQESLGGAINLLNYAQRQQLIDEERRKEEVQNIAASTLLKNAGAVGSPEYRKRTFTPNPEDAALGVNPVTFGSDAPAQNLLSSSMETGLLAKAIGPQNLLSMKMASEAAANAPFNLGPNEKRFRGSTVIASNDVAPESAYKDGEIRDFNVGDSIVPMQYNASTKGWKPVGISAPRWEPQRPQTMNPLEEERVRDVIKRGRAEDAQKARADAAAFETTDTAFENVAQRAQDLIEHPMLGANTGFFGSRAANVTTDSVDFQNQLDTLKSKLVLQAMNAARAGSANGATGFGALQEKELQILQDAIQKLNPASGAKNFIKDLAKIRDDTRKLQAKLHAARYAGFSINRVE